MVHWSGNCHAFMYSLVKGSKAAGMVLDYGKNRYTLCTIVAKIGTHCVHCGHAFMYSLVKGSKAAGMVLDYGKNRYTLCTIVAKIGTHCVQS